MQRAMLEELFQRDDREALCAAAREHRSRTLRFLVGRLYGEDGLRAAKALGWLAADRELITHDSLIELMRRFLWSLNDESGAVPFGVPEAMGEIMAHRPELRPDFLPILCSMLTSEEMFQTGAIERGVLWALARVGPATAELCPDIVTVLEEITASADDEATRQSAAAALSAVAG